MAAKKEIRSDNTYIISTDNTDNPKLGAKILSNGRERVFFLITTLDIRWYMMKIKINR